MAAFFRDSGRLYCSRTTCCIILLLPLHAGVDAPVECRADAETLSEASSSQGCEALASLAVVGEEVVFIQDLPIAIGGLDPYTYTIAAWSKGFVTQVLDDRSEVAVNVSIDGNSFTLKIELQWPQQSIIRAACEPFLGNRNTGEMPDMIASGQIWKLRDAVHEDAAIAVDGVRRDALLRRFVAWNATDLSRGRMDINRRTPGRNHPFDYQSWFSGQGFLRTQTYHGRDLEKSVWDLQLFSMLIQELKPKTIIEIGTGSGASAIWFGDELAKLGNRATVHSFGLGFKGYRSAPEHPNVVFHVIAGRDRDLETVYTDEVLAELPHPWLVDEDAHQKVQATARHFFQYMDVGDYYVCEDADSGHLPEKRKSWYAWLHECGKRCALDLMYADFYGVNQNWAPDGWIKKVAN